LAGRWCDDVSARRGGPVGAVCSLSKEIMRGLVSIALHKAGLSVESSGIAARCDYIFAHQDAFKILYT
jgi:hypothetical protein